MPKETGPRSAQEDSATYEWHTPGQNFQTGDFDSVPNPADAPETNTPETSNITPEQPSPNPAESTVISATSRLETLEGRGAEIRTNAKDTLRNTGRTIGNFIRRNGDRAIGATVIGAEKAVEFAATFKYAASERLSQRQARRERTRTNKERAKSEEYNNAKQDEAEILASVQAGDAETFNYMPDGSKLEQAGRDAAKREAVDAAHSEALNLNTQYDTAYENQKTWINAADERKDPKWMATPVNYNDVQRSAVDRANREMLDSRYEEALIEAEARQEREDAEYDKAREEAEDFLEQFKGKKDVSITDVRRVYKEKFGTTNSEHIQAAYDEAFSVFIGTKKPAAIRAARIKKGREKITALRRQYETSRDTVRSSETYQKARSLTSKIGKTISRFAKRTAKAASAARDAWHESKPVSPATESEPSTNE